MAWRFKASKYKNAAPIVPKPEACIRDIFVGSYQTYGNNIAASAAFMAFNVDHNGEFFRIQVLNTKIKIWKCRVGQLLCIFFRDRFQFSRTAIRRLWKEEQNHAFIACPCRYCHRHGFLALSRWTACNRISGLFGKFKDRNLLGWTRR